MVALSSTIKIFIDKIIKELNSFVKFGQRKKLNRLLQAVLIEAPAYDARNDYFFLCRFFLSFFFLLCLAIFARFFFFTEGIIHTPFH
jgi:hypothetical protein